jgi:hypothetical protein
MTWLTLRRESIDVDVVGVVSKSTAESLTTPAPQLTQLTQLNQSITH